MTERRVDDHGDVLVAPLLDELLHCGVDLGEAWRCSTFGGDVGAIDDEVRASHVRREVNQLSVVTERIPCPSYA